MREFASLLGQSEVIQIHPGYLTLVVRSVHEVFEFLQVIVLINCPRVVVCALLYDHYFLVERTFCGVMKLLGLERWHYVIVHPCYEQEGCINIWYDVDCPPAYVQKEPLEPSDEYKILINKV